MAFFTNVYSLDELKRTYRKLAMTFHPDHGGNVEIMKELNCEYEKLLKVFNTYGYNPNYKKNYNYNSGNSYQAKEEKKEEKTYRPRTGERSEAEKASYWEFLKRQAYKAKYEKTAKRARERKFRQGGEQYNLFDFA